MSCQSTSDVSCAVFKPITFDKTDTEATKAQVIEHDVKWERLCGK